MTPITTHCFDRMIKFGNPDCKFDAEKVLLKTEQVTPLLNGISKQLPKEWQHARKIRLLARELAEISLLVEAFAIRNFNLQPRNSDFRPQLRLQFAPKVRVNSYVNSEVGMQNINAQICALREVRKGGRHARSKAKISITIGSEKITIDKELESKFLLMIEKRKQSDKVSAKLNFIKTKKTHLNLLCQIVTILTEWCLRKGLLGEITGVDKKFGLLFSGFILSTAGYMLTPEEYILKRQLKDYRKVNDELSEKGEKKEVPRYYSYNEIVKTKLTSLIARSPKMNSRYFHGLWHPNKLVGSQQVHAF